MINRRDFFKKTGQLTSLSLISSSIINPIQGLDLVNEIYENDKVKKSKSSIKTVIIPVAGLGTRFLPATKVMPKELLIVQDRPLIQYGVEEAISAGIEKIILVTAFGKAMLEDHFDETPYLKSILQERNKQEHLDILEKTIFPAGKISAVRQQRPLGLGHAIWVARSLVPEDEDAFAVILPDDLVLGEKSCLAQMVADYQGGNMAAVMTVPKENVKNYGILDVESQSGSLLNARGVVEKPSPAEAPSQEAIVGRYILRRDIFDVLAAHKKGAGGEIQLTDAFTPMIKKGCPFYGYQFKGRRFDCGTKEGWVEANIFYAAADPHLRLILQKAIRELQLS